MYKVAVGEINDTPSTLSTVLRPCDDRRKRIWQFVFLFLFFLFSYHQWECTNCNLCIMFIYYVVKHTLTDPLDSRLHFLATSVKYEHGFRGLLEHFPDHIPLIIMSFTCFELIKLFFGWLLKYCCFTRHLCTLTIFDPVSVLPQIHLFAYSFSLALPNSDSWIVFWTCVFN